MTVGKFLSCVLATLLLSAPAFGFPGSGMQKPPAEAGNRENNEEEVYINDEALVSEFVEELLENPQIAENQELRRLADETTLLNVDIAKAILRNAPLPQQMSLFEGVMLNVGTLLGWVFGLILPFRRGRAAHPQQSYVFRPEIRDGELRISGTVSIIPVGNAPGIRFSEVHVSRGNRSVLSGEEWTIPFFESLLQISSNLPGNIDDPHIATSVLLLHSTMQAISATGVANNETHSDGTIDPQNQSREDRAVGNSD